MPRLNGFARYDWNSSLRPFGGDNNWTVGVMASWSPFAGASELSELRATASRREAADAMHEGAEAKARLEIQQSATMLRTALARLEIAERAVRQSADAHRIVSRKYAGGLAPVVELLDASAIEMQSRLGHAAVRYQVIVATAERRKALGLDPADIRSLDQAPLVAAASDSPSHDEPSHE
jgi:outer membrane protein TolC